MKKVQSYLALCLSLMLALGACLPADAASTTVQATAKGFGGDVTVTLTLDGGVLSDVAVEAPAETEAIGGRAAQLLPGAMLAAGTVAVDSVSGATVTSQAILTAAAEALAQSGVTLSGQATEIVQHMTPGTYYGEAYGKWPKGSIEGERFGSPAIIEPTKVAVIVDETSIVSVEVVSTSDTPGFTDPCVQRLPEAIVAQQSIAVDTVTGATMTSQAILNGVTMALNEAGANLAGFVVATPKLDATESYDVDMVVVGAGASGTMAAITGMEAGLNVLVLEKAGKLGGTSVCSTGFAAVESKRQIDAGNTNTVDDTFRTFMDYCNWRSNAPLVYNVLSASGATVDKMQDYWDQTDNPGAKFGTAPACDTGKGTAKFNVLYEKFLEPAGVHVMLETRAHDLIMDGDAVTGVLATRQDGTKVIVNAKSTLICTGGFGGNKQMMDDILGSSHFYLNGLSINVGDGLNMARQAGAILSEEIHPHLAEFCSNEVLDFYAGYMKFVNQLGFLTLDPSGERYVNEGFFVTEALAKGASAMRRAGTSYIVFTQHDLDSMVEQGVWGHLSEELVKELKYRARIVVPSYYTLNDEMAAALEAGEAFKADTLEALGEAIGFDPETYEATMKDYLEVIETKQDPLFGKRPELLHPLSEGPFYAVRVVPAIDGTFNGIRVNKNMQALNEQYRPITGLYVSGQDSGGYFSYPYYEGAGWTQGYAWTSGAIAGAHIVESLAS